MVENKSHVVFIHGLWLHSTSWQQWADLYAARGYVSYTPGWPGDAPTVQETRDHPESVADVGIQEVFEHYAQFIDDLEAPAVLIGHSFGGMLVEKLLGENHGIGGIAIDAAQIKGVLPLPLSSLHATLPVFKNPANKHRAVSLTADEFHYAFGNAVSREQSDLLYEQWTIPAPGRPLFEAAAANFSLHSPAKVNTENNARGPLLLIMGGRDRTVPEAITKSTLKQYKHSTAVTDLVEFADRGHSLTIDSGWREIAESCLSWLDAQEL
ncbi:UNVERIFIED_CONTAM: alpha-beta hydrolase superfamily lysophospholipase [Williamsia faeni]